MPDDLLAKATAPSAEHFGPDPVGERPFLRFGSLETLGLSSHRGLYGFTSLATLAEVLDPGLLCKFHDALRLGDQINFTRGPEDDRTHGTLVVVGIVCAGRGGTGEVHTEVLARTGAKPRLRVVG